MTARKAGDFDPPLRPCYYLGSLPPEALLNHLGLDDPTRAERPVAEYLRAFLEVAPDTPTCREARERGLRILKESPLPAKIRLVAEYVNRAAGISVSVEDSRSRADPETCALAGLAIAGLALLELQTEGRLEQSTYDEFTLGDPFGFQGGLYSWSLPCMLKDISEPGYLPAHVRDVAQKVLDVRDAAQARRLGEQLPLHLGARSVESDIVEHSGDPGARDEGPTEARSAAPVGNVHVDQSVSAPDSSTFVEGRPKTATVSAAATVQPLDGERTRNIADWLLRVISACYKDPRIGALVFGELFEPIGVRLDTSRPWFGIKTHVIEPGPLHFEVAHVPYPFPELTAGDEWPHVSWDQTERWYWSAALRLLIDRDDLEQVDGVFKLASERTSQSTAAALRDDDDCVETGDSDEELFALWEAAEIARRSKSTLEKRARRPEPHERRGQTNYYRMRELIHWLSDDIPASLLRQHFHVWMAIRRDSSFKTRDAKRREFRRRTTSSTG